MSTPVLTVSALAGLTLFMVVSLFTANGATNRLQHDVAAIEASRSHG